MTIEWLAIFRVTAVAMTTLLLSSGTFAALGGAPQSQSQSPLGRSQGKYSSATSIKSSYFAFTTVLASGTSVIEFVNAAGQVFAVSWSGPLMPDLSIFLGDYFAQYQQAVEQRRVSGQRGGVVRSINSRLVMVSRGRMSRFEGYAYVPELVPLDLDVEGLMP